MTVDLIRKHRREIMAVAMIWIAIRHSYFPINNKLLEFVLNDCGYGGVDVFFFVSSFGLYYAYKKNSNYWSFVKRRLSKVLPYSIPICIIFYLFGSKTFSEMLIDASGLSIWIRKDLIFWYTSLLLFFYVVTPLYLRLFLKKPKTVTIISIVTVSAICYFLPSFHYVYIFFRTNIFLLGFYFAYLDDNNSKANLWWLLIIMVAGWYMMYYFFHNFGNDISHVLPLFFITPGLTMLIGWFFDKVTIFRKPLNFIGIYTYQFYLVHEEILKRLYDNYEKLYVPGIGFDYLINIAGILLAFIAAILYKKTVDYVMDVIINKQEKA